MTMVMGMTVHLKLGAFVGNTIVVPAYAGNHASVFFHWHNDYGMSIKLYAQYYVV